MAGARVGEIKVPSVGPDGAKVMFVGEAPGGNEEAEGEPFVGQAGQFLTRYLGRVGIQRGMVYLTNLCKYRPKGNKFELLLGSNELARGLEELDAEIYRVQPNLIVACGNWPMYYLTGCTASKGKPGTGITSWRGSVVPGVGSHVPAAAGRKVLITYHPAFVMRPEGFQNHPIFYNDIKRITREWDFPEIEYPPYTEFIDPPNIEEVAHSMLQGEMLTVDIETFGNSLACVGVTDSVERGLCVTFENSTGWNVVREMLLHDIPKNLQYGAFDVNYLKWFYGWDVKNYAFDTYIGAANLLPEFKRGLDFLTSIYTPYPYYKEDRKIHKQTGDLTTLWKYNIKDLIAQHWIAIEQIKELEDLYGKTFDLKELAVFT